MTMAGFPSAASAYLVCRSGPRLCALPIEQVVETMRPLPTSPLAAMPPFLMGAAIIRGAVVPVVNLARLMGDAETVPPSRFVTIALEARTVAFAVECVVGVRILKTQTVDDIPLLLQAVDTGCVAAITVLDAELLLLLQSARLIPDSVWDALNSQVALP